MHEDLEDLIRFREEAYRKTKRDIRLAFILSGISIALSLWVLWGLL